MRALRLLAALLALAAPLSAQPAPQPAADAARVRLGTALSADTVTVGDPFELRVRIQAPAGAAVTFPTAPDSASAVEGLDPRRDRTTPGDAVDVTAVYRLAAWDVGTLPITLGDVVVRIDGAERRVPLRALQVHVRSVLPADSAQRVPKPAREPIADPGLWWLQWLLLALALLALLALLLLLARRWLRRRRPAPVAGGAYAAAVAAFDRLDGMRLVEAGETGRHAALAEEILRDYLVARLSEADPSHTSVELRAALAAREEVPQERLHALLDLTDLVKFAALPLAPAAATEAGREARGVVDAVEQGIAAREAREREEAEARAREERDAQKRYEEEQRRRALHDDRGERAA
ncbi:hypothetical protein [Roseisolibacter sp. H3M3-2]|uniref:hypothetical protein n=1 Tax=Roseisolibacter sp. H3M3-2 TaxID=3031323 RepID=UPI0023DC94D9|nr:hypothetical protein [Roseisolibacter sp. H3M3-2]MDF1505309.1 hypothetical protein [Roseisolibacter sp. H3M3-2]